MSGRVEAANPPVEERSGILSVNPLGPRYKRNGIYKPIAIAQDRLVLDSEDISSFQHCSGKNGIQKLKAGKPNWDYLRGNK